MAKKINITFYVDDIENKVNLWEIRKLLGNKFGSNFRGIIDMEVENGTNA